MEGNRHTLNAFR